MYYLVWWIKSIYNNTTNRTHYFISIQWTHTGLTHYRYFYFDLHRVAFPRERLDGGPHTIWEIRHISGQNHLRTFDI